MQEGTNAKQQIVEKLKNSTNILVTVSANPSVDALSAALGLTLMLNKMDKHGTAVFSGSVPPAIKFLEPEKTFEDTTDSLRDFIVALDKEKADRLRYKVDGDMVRIYITPFRTTITEEDLEFSQGDFNVEAIVALGVEKREDLDKAISEHGRILHDAAVMTINNKAGNNNLGAVDWLDAEASSLSEMLVALSEALQSGILDEQISNALLTGIVAATDRFSNELTKPRVMTMAAQLMAAGANQQLIATKLEDSHVINESSDTSSKNESNNDGSTHLKENTSSKVHKEKNSKSESSSKKKDSKKSTDGDDTTEASPTADKDKPAEKEDENVTDGEEEAADKDAKKDKDSLGEMQISHAADDTQEQPPHEPHIESDTAGLTPEQIEEKKQNDAVHAAEGALADAASGQDVPMSPMSPALADLEKELEKEAKSMPQESKPVGGGSTLKHGITLTPPSEPQAGSSGQKIVRDTKSARSESLMEPPSMGGTLNATSEQALKDKLMAEEEARNYTVLHHLDKPVNENKGSAMPSLSPDISTAASSSSQPANELPPVAPPLPSVAPPILPESPQPPSSLPPTPPLPTPPPPISSPPNLSTDDNISAARDAVNAAINSSPVPPPPPLEMGDSLGMPGYEATPPPAPSTAPAPSSVPTASPNINVPPPPPLPEMNNLPPMPSESTAEDASGLAAMPSENPNVHQASQGTNPLASPDAGQSGNVQASNPFGPPPQPSQDPTPSTQVPRTADPGQFKIPGR